MLFCLDCGWPTVLDRFRSGGQLRMTRSQREGAGQLDAGTILKSDARQLTAAVAAIGGHNPDERLAWLMSFVEADLAATEDPGHWSVELEMFGQTSTFWLDKATADLLMHHRGIEPSETDLIDIQADIRRGLRDLRTKRAWYFDAPRWRGLVWEGQDPCPFMSGTLREMVMAAIADLLITVGPRLRACEAPGCERYFAARRPHQRRCSTRCTNRVTAARYRAAHPEKISDDRHEAYQKHVRAGLPKRRTGVGGRKRKRS